MDHRRGQEPLDTRDARAIFSGDLSEVALVDLVQTLELGRRTGVVHLTGPAGRAATLWLRDGRPVDCELGAIQGEAAFHRLLRWTEGGFAVEFEPVTRPARIAASTQALVLEGLRRAEAWRAAAARLPDLGAPVEIDYRLLSDRLAEIPDDVNALLRTVDGRRTVEQVIDDAGLDELAAAAMVERLFAEQILRLAPPRAAPAAPARAATPDPERVTWFAGPSEREPAPTAPAAQAAPAARPRPAPAAAAPARPRAAPPDPAPQPEGRPGEPRPPRIVRFPPREKVPAPTPRPGDPGTPPPAAPEPAARRAPARPPAARRAPASGSRALRVGLALAMVALAAAVAWGRWRGGGRASASVAYEAEVAEARRLQQAGRLEEAIAGYRRALAGHDTSDGEAELGRMLAQAAQPAAAIAALQRAVELDGANAGAYIALGEALLGEQRAAEARGAFERYLALEPQGGRAEEVRAALERMK
ncbi:DUF4388 domain-containing protein [Anaeromyxobacter diazotrophicus]|uniref:PatA-like N-terminal domain-containing protein n=1 Tax=Anaeromyxobacter diazotrophicus TaxID=2590199 RepID=A0A7I9VL67_9BACT|nr:DUF4388 domain-containing protein [Anaeromyxobacter diazotrophicus]GEJ56849.1 hypothetical protein AMYX_15900 [Anaeromyxobacter diazotrophicus]